VTHRPADREPERDETTRRIREFVKFMAVGTSGVIVNLGAYYLLTRFGDLSLTLASPLAIEASILWNFLLNDRWTFRHRETDGGGAVRLGRFHAVSVIAGVVNYGLLIALAALGWWDMLANLVGIVLGGTAKFAVNSSWTWREQATTPVAASVEHVR
jgi:dolichol-phosphate mannosyltransferase